MVKEHVAKETQGGKEAVVGSGKTSISQDVLANIAGKAAEDVPGVASLAGPSLKGRITGAIGDRSKHERGVAVEAGENEATLDLQLNVLQGYNIPEVVEEVRAKVYEQLLSVAGLTAKEVNISVVGIEGEGKKEEKKVK